MSDRFKKGYFQIYLWKNIIGGVYGSNSLGRGDWSKCRECSTQKFYEPAGVSRYVGYIFYIYRE